MLMLTTLGVGRPDPEPGLAVGPADGVAVFIRNLESKEREQPAVKGFRQRIVADPDDDVVNADDARLLFPILKLPKVAWWGTRHKHSVAIRVPGNSSRLNLTGSTRWLAPFRRPLLPRIALSNVSPRGQARRCANLAAAWAPHCTIREEGVSQDQVTPSGTNESTASPPRPSGANLSRMRCPNPFRAGDITSGPPRSRQVIRSHFCDGALSANSQTKETLSSSTSRTLHRL